MFQAYDSLTRIPPWAKETLAEHKNDRREHVYTEEQVMTTRDALMSTSCFDHCCVWQFEFAQTHDTLWNATQLELVHKGKMHSYCRMYWAKQVSPTWPHAIPAASFTHPLPDTELG